MCDALHKDCAGDGLIEADEIVLLTGKVESYVETCWGYEGGGVVSGHGCCGRLLVAWRRPELALL